MLKINLKQLEAFTATAEYGSFTRAAEELYLTQSTISTHILTLEAALDVQLILRGARRKLTLTEEGRRVYGAARDILDRCQLLQDPESPVRRVELSVGASTAPAQYLLPGLLSGFLQRHGDSRFFLRRGDSTQVHNLMSQGEVRMGVVGAALDRRSFTYQMLCDDRLVLTTAATERFRTLKAQGVCGRDMLDELFIVREETSGTRRAAENYWRKCGILPEELRIVACMDNPEAIRRSVAEGMGVSVMSELSVREDVAAGKLLTFDLDEKGFSRRIYLAWRKDVSLTRTEQAFVSYIRSELKK
ncbi:putative LysR family transcriptional regulator [Oscillibacter valericigenes Sjm18-20]|nr:putative LysR family transcriptional regulator [Oscillibacter valericigenes Sjm18-20]